MSIYVYVHVRTYVRICVCMYTHTHARTHRIYVLHITIYKVRLCTWEVHTNRKWIIKIDLFSLYLK